MKKVKMKVNGIHCGGCAQKIKNAVCALDASTQADVDVATGDVKIQFDGNSVKTGQLKEAITKVGFTVESMEIE